jgi:hypothetical protein
MKLLRMPLLRIFLNEFKVKDNLLRNNFDEEYNTYRKLKTWFNGKRMDKQHITIYSPGAGSDFGTTLMIYDAIVSPKNKEATFIFIDIRDFFDGMPEQLKKYTSKPLIKKESSQDSYKFTAYYNDKVFNIIYYVRDAAIFPEECKEGIDIYYERAFELFRSKDPMIDYNIYKNINKLGLAITDHSFDFRSQKKYFKRLKKIPKRFGLYNNFQIWQKKA